MLIALRNYFIAALSGAAISCSSEQPDEASTTQKEELESVEYGNRVRLTTSLGQIIFELDPEKAPKSVESFLNYVDEGHYDGTVFHRVIDGYLIEGGRLKIDGGNLIEADTKDPIPNEARNGLDNLRATIAMARTARPESATAPFFINLGDNIGLNYPQPDGHGYAVFGRVIEGMKVVDEIGQAETGQRSLTLRHPATGKLAPQEVADVPLQAVTILSASRISN